MSKLVKQLLSSPWPEPNSWIIGSESEFIRRDTLIRGVVISQHVTVSDEKPFIWPVRIWYSHVTICNARIIIKR